MQRHSVRGYAGLAAVIVGVSESWWAWLSRFVIGLPPHASYVRWTLVSHISSFGPKNSEVYFIMGLTSDPNYRKLEQWYKSSAGNLNMRQMFDADQDRFNKFRWNTHPTRFISPASHSPRINVSCSWDLHLAHNAYTSNSLVYNTMYALFLLASSFNIGTRNSVYIVTFSATWCYKVIATSGQYMVSSSRLRHLHSCTCSISSFTLIYTHW